MKTCKIEGCGRKTIAKGFCSPHYERQRLIHKCKIDGCKKTERACGLCSMHYARNHLHGIFGLRPRPPRKTTKKINGYPQLYIPNHPNAGKDGWLAQHTVIMSEMIGRPIGKNESVHHKNGIKDDNRPENLELATRFHTKGQSVEDMIKFCREYIKEYGWYREFAKQNLHSPKL